MPADHSAPLVGPLAEALQRIEAADLDCPEGVDRFLWSADLLDEMARSVETIARIVDVHAASDADVVRERAAGLSQLIIRHRNELIDSGRGARPAGSRTSWPGRPETTADEGAAGPRARPPVSPARRLMEREWSDRPSTPAPPPAPS